LHARLEVQRKQIQVPCHGSGYDSEGVNFEGPAPRPMDRAHVELAPDGQIVVDTSRLYQWLKGQPSRFSDPGSFCRYKSWPTRKTKRQERQIGRHR